MKWQKFKMYNYPKNPNGSMRIIDKICNDCIHGEFFADIDYNVGEYICSISKAMECKPDTFADLFNVVITDDFIEESEMVI